MLVLGLESTCDETAAAVVRDGKKILSNIVSSQIDLHLQYGGVVPELACRRHVDIMIPVIEEACRKAGVTIQDIDLFAVSKGPGLIGALLIGVNAAKTLAYALGKPFVGINHVEAHLYAAMMGKEIPMPALGVILSGGHTTLALVRAIGQYERIGHTVDDAIGEAFDKTAKILSLPYPGGPEIEKLAKKGDPHRYPFKGGNVKGHPFNFSFSGLKTAVLYAFQKEVFTEQVKADIAASFQRAAFEDVMGKVERAASHYECQHILFGGGVTNSRTLREWLQARLPYRELHFPSFELTLDNAAMIAGLGYHRYRLQGKSDPFDLEATAVLDL